MNVVRGIGLWMTLFDCVGYMAIFTNLALLAFTSNTLDSIVSLSVYDKLLLLVAVEHVVVLAKVGIAAAVPDVPARMLNAIARRDFLATAWVQGVHRAAAQGGRRAGACGGLRFRAGRRGGRRRERAARRARREAAGRVRCGFTPLRRGLARHAAVQAAAGAPARADAALARAVGGEG
mmetsp:Transcript_32212/g.80200  ORF Transcript_32212/g.80200 Transcript_32212/m.80200 type:complete len:178 (-) Transcript_32212:2362-2895(-)